MTNWSNSSFIETQKLPSSLLTEIVNLLRIQKLKMEINVRRESKSGWMMSFIRVLFTWRGEVTEGNEMNRSSLSVIVTLNEISQSIDFSRRLFGLISHSNHRFRLKCLRRGGIKTNTENLTLTKIRREASSASNLISEIFSLWEKHFENEIWARFVNFNDFCKEFQSESFVLSTLKSFVVKFTELVAIIFSSSCVQFNLIFIGI